MGDEGQQQHTGGFGPRLADLLQVGDLTQSQLAERLEISRSAVNEWINERSLPAPGTVFAIERALGVDPGELSVHLGFLPTEAVASLKRTFAEVVRGLPELSEESKEALVDVYESLKRADQRRAARRQAARRGSRQR